MRCVLIDNPGPQNRLLIVEQEKPSCSPEQLLVRVKAAGVNRADLLQRRGKYPPPAGESTIPGLEIAGVVEAVGSAVNQFQPGDHVYGLVAGGAYADYCCVHQNLAALIPDGLSFSTAAALPEALTTAHVCVFLIGQLKPGQIFLIHAVGSGIASMAIQMARYQGASVITTASSQEKITKASSLGATQIINYKTEDFAALLGEQSIDLIVDFIGGDYFAKHLKLLKPQGKLVQIACMQGAQVNCDLVALMQKRLNIYGFVLRTQSLEEKTAIWQSMQQRWAQALNNKDIVPIIDSEFDLNDIEAAFARMQDNQHFGKIIILM